MPFSKHQIDPAHIEAMRAAFKKVCDALLLKCDREEARTGSLRLSSMIWLPTVWPPLRSGEPRGEPTFSTKR
jgi:hypothetical protein